jgi:catechol 2,3-dioxygenase-like lactoylglutathione lyase family enzyme
VAFVVYPVKDVKAARLFYEGPLGLKVTANWNDQWVEYDISDGTLALTAADASHRAGVHGATVDLEVVDLDAAVARMRQLSVPIVDGPFDSPACRGCVIRDPDGNELILRARK